MAVKNALQQRKSAAATTYEAGGSQITLTPDIVRKYLVSGSGNVTDQEIAMFISLCRYSHLNPWVHEAYCIKYGSSPATMVVSKEAFQKRAETNPAYDGASSGIVVEDDQTGEVVYRTGTLKRPGETVIGGWAEIYRKDRTHSTQHPRRGKPRRVHWPQVGRIGHVDVGLQARDDDPKGRACAGAP